MRPTNEEYQAFVEEMILPQVSRRDDQILGLAAEFGEVCGKLYKAERDNDGFVDEHALLLELGDVLFYVTALCNHYGFELEEVMEANVAKLKARKAAGTLQGSGDRR